MRAGYTSLILGTVLVLSASPGRGDVAGDAIADCARLVSTADRILCLENALRALAGDGSEAARPPGGNHEPPAAGAMPDAPPAAAASTAAAGASTVPRRDRAAGETAAVPTAELGAEQVAARNGEDEAKLRVSAHILEHELVGSGRLRLTLDNGQVWLQTGDDDAGISRRIRGETGIEVEMYQSRSGGYRMHLVEIDRTLRVRRLR